MRSPDFDTLVLYHYGELDAECESRLRRQLETDPAARARLDEIRRSLALADEAGEPAADPDLAGRIWAGVDRRLPPVRRAHGWRVYRPVLAAAAVAVLALAVKLVFSVPEVAPPHGEPVAPLAATGGGLQEGARERVFAFTMAEHLDRSGRLLRNVRRLEPDAPGVTTPDEARVRTVLAGGRMLRQAAGDRLDPATRDLLLEVEMLLTELAHQDPAEADAVRRLQARLEESDLLFRLGVVASQSRPAAARFGDFPEL